MRADEVENAPVWAHLLFVVLTGPPTASPELRQGIAPSFFCRATTRGKGRKNAMSDMGQNEGVEDASACDAPDITQYRVSFLEAVRRFCTTYTSNGRASRSEYWWSLLFCFVLILGVSAIFGEMVL